MPPWGLSAYNTPEKAAQAILYESQQPNSQLTNPPLNQYQLPNGEKLDVAQKLWFTDPDTGNCTSMELGGLTPTQKLNLYVQIVAKGYARNSACPVSGPSPADDPKGTNGDTTFWILVAGAGVVVTGFLIYLF